MRSLSVDAVDEEALYIAKTADESRGDVVVDSGWNESQEDLNLFNGDVEPDSENYLL